MKNTILIKLKFNGPVHFGEPGIGVEKCSYFPRSDTLFSAVCSAWRLRFGIASLEELLDAFTKDDEIVKVPPFVLSSGFPFAGGKYFLPYPNKLFNKTIAVEESSVESTRKKKKKSKFPYVESAEFNRIIGRTGDSQFEDDHESDLNEHFQYVIDPGVAIDRLSGQTEIYHRGKVFISETAGVFFLLRFAGNEIREKVIECLDCLSHKGLGGERSIGLGSFEFSVSEEDIISTPTNPVAYLNLSLYNPSSGENQFLDEKHLISYDFEMRGGWASSPDFPEGKRLAALRFFREASIFGFEPNGRLVNVNPNGRHPHPVFKNGMSFSIPTVI